MLVAYITNMNNLPPEMLDKGDIDGQKTWLRILKAIASLEDKTPSGTVH